MFSWESLQPSDLPGSFKDFSRSFCQLHRSKGCLEKVVFVRKGGQIGESAQGGRIQGETDLTY